MIILFIILYLVLNHLFVTRSHIYKIINESYFFDRMSVRDLNIRGASSCEAYKESYKRSIISFTLYEKVLLHIRVYQANIYLKPYKKLYNIPWRFAKIHNKESNYPHTLGDTIILPGIVDIETLIHEKIHIFQRLYPTETSHIISDIWGFYPKMRMEDCPDVRNNPDVDSFIYTNHKLEKGKYMAQIYDEGATKIGQAHTLLMPDRKIIYPENLGLDPSIRQFEHPNEIMAELLAAILAGGYAPLNRGGLHSPPQPLLDIFA